MYFDTSILIGLFTSDITWKIIKWCYTKAKGEHLESMQGNKTFIFGTNRFMGCPNVLVVNAKPIIKIDTLGDKLYLSADFYDRDGQLVMRIIRNKIKLNKDNVFEVQEWKKEKIRIINQYNEPIEIIAHKTGEIELNGVFYCEKNRFEATSQGLKIN